MLCAKCGYDPDAVVSARYELHVDRDPPSLNERLFNTGARAYLYRKERDTWCWELRAVRLLKAIPRAKPGSRRRVTLVRVLTKRHKTRDQDNLVGGMKLCVDALVNEGLIFNDDPTHAELHYQQSRVGEPGLRITIEVFA